MTNPLQQEPFINAANATTLAKRSHARRRAGTTRAIQTQAIDFQQAWHRAGKLFTADLQAASNAVERAIAAAQLSRATDGWDKVTARLLILNGHAAPGSLSPAERRAIREAKRTRREPSAPKAAPKSVTPQNGAA